MSIKATKFQEALGNPMNTFNFMIIMGDEGKGLTPVQIFVTATTFPSEALQEFTTHFMGERVKFPSIPTNSGEWNCTMIESEAAKVFNAFKGHYEKVYNQKTGQLSHIAMYDKFNIEIYGCGLNGDITASTDVGLQRKVGVKLHGCFLKGKGDVSLDNSNATGVWNWQFNFSYDWIEDIEPSEQGTRKSAFTENTNP